MEKGNNKEKEVQEEIIRKKGRTEEDKDILKRENFRTEKKN